MELVVFAAPLYWRYGDYGHGLVAPPDNGGDCTSWRFDCTVNATTQGLIALILFFGACWFALWLYLLYRSKGHLFRQPYSDFKMANLSLRIQERMDWVFIVLFVVTFGLLWYVKPGSCRSVLYTWLGLLPMQVMSTTNTLSRVYMFMPCEPRHRTPLLQVWLQEFAWTRPGMVKRLIERNQHSGTCGILNRQPMFCFEIAFKAFYWAGLVYDNEEAQDVHLKVSVGYELFGLHSHEVIREPALDTKVLIGWGDDTVVVSFRGTASARNAATDIQFWRTSHPERKGRWWHRLGQQPMVHAGFLKAWQYQAVEADQMCVLAKGKRACMPAPVGLRFDQRILSRVMELITGLTPSSGRCPKLLITGHSLGGALAELAAFDLARELRRAGNTDCMLACYTLGAPRLGNHAFAKLFRETVPDCWSLINDQDVVARRGKLLFMYKRPGHRAIINSRGDLIVRPSYAEASVQRVPGGIGVSHHYLGSYQQSLLAICLAQFSAKRYRSGMQGVLSLAESSKAMADLFQQELDLSISDMRRLSRWGDLADRVPIQKKLIKNIRRTRDGWASPIAGLTGIPGTIADAVESAIQPITGSSLSRSRSGRSADSSSHGRLNERSSSLQDSTSFSRSRSGRGADLSSHGPPQQATFQTHHSIPEHEAHASQPSSARSTSSSAENACPYNPQPPLHDDIETSSPEPHEHLSHHGAAGSPSHID
ncbi:hypothetical protein WJX84_004530 [Apatococcus fuscideae]|uniref:Fungal lipase-type domain-containing protein n=1 Tax=Apatococcus fuscideae TaxID=2026836 RepID=A0AAW1RTT0_9CHLO